MLTDEDKIKMLRKGIMMAVVQLFSAHPDAVLKMFTLEELETIANDTADMTEEKLEGYYKDVLDVTE